VVSGKNDRLRRVVAFPGFDLRLTSRASPEVVSLRERIFEIGEKWQKGKRGESNLRDAYLTP
jgi:hypothetical protein